ncbi:hypothetical protein FKR81_11290 [Lentzea tibetensis]|uniref:Uncharacterized protein n=1 Tax=Lentzea tibetensis TaxID=2591470 RepID=A0A563EWR2_9PSEU|nr:hypothetical protein [Lentzea tibetensis]TWP52157.1 hypothetical protein FKR81_11290 [Lentzea tibetensis]
MASPTPRLSYVLCLAWAVPSIFVTLGALWVTAGVPVTLRLVMGQLWLGVIPWLVSAFVTWDHFKNKRPRHWQLALVPLPFFLTTFFVVSLAAGLIAAALTR